MARKAQAVLWLHLETLTPIPVALCLLPVVRPLAAALLVT
jgi:uncharacterized protein (DUF983 family)